MTPHDSTSGVLRLARWVTIILIVLTLGMHVVGVAVWGQILQQPCFEPNAVCQQTRPWLLPEQAAALEASGIPLTTYAALEVLKIIFFSSIWMGVGGLILIRKPNEWIALVVAFTLITFPALWDGIALNLARVYPVMYWPVQILLFLINLGLPLFLALFPNGRWVPRWTPWLMLITVLISTFGNLKLGGDQNGTEALGFLALSMAFYSLLFVAQIIRYWRYSTPIERLQARWVVTGIGAALAIVIGMVIVTALNLLPSTGPLSGFASEIVYQLAVVLIPLSVTVAILRYRLFDIDVIIRKTLQYSVLSGLLGLTYFGLVVVLQNLTSALGGQRSEFVTVLSTLAIAALFFPLRNRVQEFIDKRFYRKKYDAQKVLAEFAATCRDETDLDKLTARLVEVIDETLQPEKVSVWIKDNPAPKP